MIYTDTIGFFQLLSLLRPSLSATNDRKLIDKAVGICHQQDTLVDNRINNGSKKDFIRLVENLAYLQQAIGSYCYQRKVSDSSVFIDMLSLKEFFTNVNQELINSKSLMQSPSSITSDGLSFIDLQSLVFSCWVSQENVRPKVTLGDGKSISKQWKTREKEMHTLHEAIWKKTRINISIMNSAHFISRDEEIIFFLA
ncbi:hypothetical protein M9H77_14879 [Catharanthus roseus]|uniref:Uncharacterized protein n=1 Tax=Catharanthus roseus TaxID=4058 RepID=A0ACC0BPD0_CATRO|nr:hypothetical protein M9H77_14879 [Catharanthus roseus]